MGAVFDHLHSFGAILMGRFLRPLSPPTLFVQEKDVPLLYDMVLLNGIAFNVHWGFQTSARCPDFTASAWTLLVLLELTRDCFELIVTNVDIVLAVR